MSLGGQNAKGPACGLRGAEDSWVMSDALHPVLSDIDVDNDEYQYGHDVRNYHCDGEGDLSW